jgi:hypothetical protein
MSLIRRQTTEAMVAANRANSLTSTGPLTDIGKIQARINAQRDGLCARGGPVIRELHERLEDFEELQSTLWRDLAPSGGLEMVLVEQIVENRWRYRRILRTESSLLVAHRLKFDLDHARARAGESRSPSSAGEARLANELGLASLPDSGVKFTFILQCLREARQLIGSEGFGEAGLKRLEAVFGPNPGLAGAALLARYRQCQRTNSPTDAPSAPPDPQADRSAFLALLDAEITSFRKLRRLNQISSDQLAAAVQGTLQMLPSDDLNRILRYESFLDRQYERLLEQLRQHQASVKKDRAERSRV